MAKRSRQASRRPSPDIRQLSLSFELALRAENRAPKTIRTYLDALTQFAAFLEQAGRSLEIEQIERSDIQTFIAHLLAIGRKPATANNRHRSLQAFFKWAEGDELIERSPMSGLRPPAVPEAPPSFPTNDQLKRLPQGADTLPDVDHCLATPRLPTSM